MADQFRLVTRHEVTPALVIGAGAAAAVLAGLGNWLVQWAAPIFSGADLADLGQFLLTRTTLPSLGLSTDAAPLAGSVTGAALAAWEAAKLSARDDHMVDPDESEGDQSIQQESAWAPYAHTKTTVKVGGSRKREEWGVPVPCERVEDDNMLLTENARLALSNHPDRRWRPPNHHAFVIAGSGSGKTFNFITSNVLQCNASYLFTDPKGELLSRFGSFLDAHGYAVRFIDLRPDEASILSSFHWNPLHYCQSGTQVDDFVSRLIASTTSPESKSANSDFFTNMEKLAYGALMKMELFWFGKDHPEDYNVPSIYDWLGMLKTTGGVESELYDVFFGKEGLSYERFVRERHPGLSDQELRLLPEWEAIADFQGFMSDADSPETAASVLSSCYNRLHPFMNYAVRTIMSGEDELELDQLGKRKQALFMITADSGGPYDFLAAILTSQIFSINARIGDDSPGHHLPVPVICYLDELANIGRLPNLDKLFATLRSRWINLVAITQYSDQLKVSYSEGARGIMANCSVIEYLGAGDLKTCEDVSKMLGDRTVHYTDYSVTRSATGGSVTESVRRVKQAVYTAQQLFNISQDPNRCLVHLSNAGWIEGRKPDPTKHPRWGEIGGAHEVTDFKGFSRVQRGRLLEERAAVRSARHDGFVGTTVIVGATA
ncbi:VirD4-like conjugal transfer protein, CD1115 family [Olsenella uli]|uniref:VirD4-like conjugal transfer protein, CD1115 family n=2 Tax=Olsenella uli TaxID=133926 RepID=UPI00241FD41D|nr:type IV secretory system conjugative DNA transfer family protein [Olsenella uli]